MIPCELICFFWLHTQPKDQERAIFLQDSRIILERLNEEIRLQIKCAHFLFKARNLYPDCLI